MKSNLITGKLLALNYSIAISCAWPRLITLDISTICFSKASNLRVCIWKPDGIAMSSSHVTANQLWRESAINIMRLQLNTILTTSLLNRQLAKTLKLPNR